MPKLIFEAEPLLMLVLVLWLCVGETESKGALAREGSRSNIVYEFELHDPKGWSTLPVVILRALPCEIQAFVAKTKYCHRPYVDADIVVECPGTQKVGG